MFGISGFLRQNAKLKPFAANALAQEFLAAAK